MPELAGCQTDTTNGSIEPFPNRVLSEPSPDGRGSSLLVCGPSVGQAAYMHETSACLDPIATPPPALSAPPPVPPKHRLRGRGVRFPAPDPPKPPDRPFDGLSVDVSTRRRFAVCSRLAHRTQTDTAALVGVSQSTISRDLQMSRKEGLIDWRRPASEEIGEALWVYDDCLRMALEDLDRLAACPERDGGAVLRVKLDYHRVIVLAVTAKFDLLRQVGLLRPGTVQPPHRGQSGDEIHLMMKALGLSPELLRREAGIAE